MLIILPSVTKSVKIRTRLTSDGVPKADGSALANGFGTSIREGIRRPGRKRDGTGLKSRQAIPGILQISRRPSEKKDKPWRGYLNQNTTESQ
jgi:hypothetical protein